MHSERLIGLPVVHIDLGKRFGTVQALVLDPKGRRLAGMVVALEGWRKRGLLPVECIYAVGEQAVTIEHEDALMSTEEDSELRTLWRRRLDLRGMQVLTVTGRDLGKVSAFLCSQDGTIETLYLGRTAKRRRGRHRSTIPGTLVRSFGEDAVIVAAEAAEWLENDHAPDDEVDIRGDIQFVNENEDESGPSKTALAERVLDRLVGWGRRAKVDEGARATPEGPPPGGE